MKLLVISDLHAHNDVLDKMDDIFAKADEHFSGKIPRKIMLNRIKIKILN